MAKCATCGKWGLFLKLQDGLCPSCVVKAQSHEEDIPAETTVNAAAIDEERMFSTEAKPVTQEKQKPRIYKTTGIQHYIDNLLRLAVSNADYGMSKREMIECGLINERVWKNEFYPIKAEIEPEPDNPLDPKAIKVVVDGEHVGYVKAGSCSHLLKVIREGRIEKIECTIVGGPYKYIEEDYNENGKEIYTLDRDEANYSVTLHITET